MIECTNTNIYYKKRPKNKRLFSVFLVLTIIISSVLYYRFIIVRNIFEICSSSIYSSSNDAVNTSVLKVFNSQLEYGDFINVDKNQSGEIVLISANAHAINLVNKQIVEETKVKLTKTISDGIQIPFMAFSGIKILSGYGKKINFKAISIESVNSEFQSEFVSVGINQTLHSIYALVTCEVKIHPVLKEQIEKVETKVLISESILIGKVPSVYFSGNLFE